MNLAYICNRLTHYIVQKLQHAGVALAALAWLVGGLTGSCVRATAAPATIDRAEEAVRLAKSGSYTEAAVIVRRALSDDPANPLLHHIAATLLLVTGDVDGASSEWDLIRDTAPDDGLAQYGQGLVALARGDRDRALDALLLAERTGDRSYCLLAERYIEALGDAFGASSGMVLPDAFMPSLAGINGYMVERSGDHRKALYLLDSSLSALPGDPYSEVRGVVMTFDKSRPIAYGASALPKGNGLVTPRAKAQKPPLNGTVTLKASDADSDTGFVMFKIDGALSCIVNNAPFSLVWDTSKSPNGPHKVEIAIYGKDGQPAGKSELMVRTANSNAPGRISSTTPRSEAVKAELWSLLLLRPSRLAMAYTAAACAHALVEMPDAQRYTEIAAAISPNYRDVAVKMAASAPGGGVPLWRGALNDNVVALTFDDGPKPGYTDKLLQVLQTQRVPATFFVIGRHTTAYPEVVRKIADAGMEIEDHSYTHPNLRFLPIEEVMRELLKTVASVRAATGKRLRYFRPPGGNVNPQVYRAAAKLGLTACMWTLDGERIEKTTAPRLIDFIVRGARPGAIILLHNGRDVTIDALPSIIEGLRRRGFEFVTVEQLATRKANLEHAGKRG